MADLTEPLLQDCTHCGTRIDVSDEEPFAQMHCPGCGSAMRVRRKFGSFELQEILGAGGMGAVYRALDTNLHRQVALKLLRKEYSSNPEFIRQFAHEAAITALINHPNVVKVYSSGSDHGLFYIAMELVDKGSLDDLMTLETKVGEMQVLDVGIQIAQGLNAAYEKGLIHRDVKPGNILFADSQTAKIVDFGLAVPMHEAGTLGGEIWGTPYYVAPEKLDNKPEDFRSDIFSLAASLFHAATGRPPHDTDETSIAALKKAKTRTVSVQMYAPEISNATTYVINRALHFDPDQRYASYKDFIEHLQYAKEELRQKAAKLRAKNKAAHLPPATSHTGRNHTLLGLLAAVLIGGGALYYFKDEIFGTRGEPTEVVNEPDPAQAEIDEEYKKAQELLIGGKYAEAASGFASVGSNLLTRQPLRTWAAAHAALASTLAGDTPGAKTYWEQIIAQDLFSTEPQDQKLAQWFLNTAKLVIAEGPVPDGIEEQYSRSNYELFAVLALGVKCWSGGQFDGAQKLLQAFHDSSPELGNSWLGDYKAIATALLAELNEYRALRQLTKETENTTPQQKDLAEIKEGLSRLKMDGPHREQIAEAVEKLEQRAAAQAEEQVRLQAEQEAADAKLLGGVQPKVGALMAKYRFSEARVLLAGIKVQSEKGRQQKERMMRKVEWPGAFKLQLMRDVNIAGFAQPVLNRAGGRLPGTLAKATEEHLEFTSQFGQPRVAWPDVSVESLLQIAKSFVPRDSSPQAKADRDWLIGSFAYFAGKASEAKALLKSASTVRPEYRPLLESVYPDLAGE